MKILWIIALVIFAAGSVGVAMQQGLIASPMNFTMSQGQSAEQATNYLAGIDQSLAQQIRDWRENGWQPPEILGSISQSVEQAGNSTVSATVTTTPQEVWQSFREQGAQAALGQVAGSAEVTVNSVSQNVLNEARYQYCLGVVEAHETQSAE